MLVCIPFVPVRQFSWIVGHDSIDTGSKIWLDLVKVYILIDDPDKSCIATGLQVPVKTFTIREDSTEKPDGKGD